MNRVLWLVGGIVFFVLASLTTVITLNLVDPVVMRPSGPVGVAQRDLFVLALVIMSVVAVPVLGLLGFIAWRYRASNHRATYTPEWQSSPLLETLWWGIPILVVGVLSVVAWQTSHSLDPFQPIKSESRTLKVQVVALQWKWLFIYPEHDVASVNELVIPVSTPVAFEIAADAPMNSFWIPELGGQIYAMNGMTSRLHLQADRVGEFRGVSSNLSGEGFADMKFTVRSVDATSFLSLMTQRQRNAPALDMTQYEAVAVPGTTSEPLWFRLADKQLFSSVINKYMLPNTMYQTYDGPGEPMNHGGMH